MRQFLTDLRLSLRLMARERGFTAVAVVVLALGIGANTAIFTIVNALLLAPRSGAADTLVGVYSKDRVEPDTFRAFSFREYTELREQPQIFQAVTAHFPALVGITEGEITRRAFIDIATANYFDTFASPLAMGRSFTEDEARPAADVPVTILSHAAWQKQGARADVLGSTVRINQRAFEVIGVSAKGFGGSAALIVPELWVPTGVYDTISNDFAREGKPASLADPTHRNLIVLAKLRPGLTNDAAGPLLDALSTAREQGDPLGQKNQQLTIAPLSRLSVSTSPQTDGALTAATAVLLAMAAIVLIVASLNLANMLLARGASRQKEFAIRLALGGSRSRVIRQLLTEGLTLALAGGTAGVLLGWAATKWLISSMAGLLPVQLSFEPAPDVRVILATLVFCTGSTMVFALGPAWALAKTSVLPELKEQAGALRGGRRRRFATQHLLVMGQLALSLALLSSAGLFMRGAMVAADITPGFTLDRGIVANLDTSLAGFDTPRSMEVYRQAVERVSALPGVRAAALGTLMPFAEFSESESVQKPGPVLKRSDAGYADGIVDAVPTSVSAGYFPALGLALVAGRDFTIDEVSSTASRPVAIIDAALSSKLFGEANPIGRHVQLNNRDGQGTVLEVVGVAPPIRHQLVDKAPVPHFYRPLGQSFRTAAYLHVRTGAESADAEAAMLPLLRSTLRGVDERLPVLALETRATFRDRNLMLWMVRAGASIFTAFGVVALFMAAIGLYGVKAYLVARRTREIGIRVALGATPRAVIWMVARDGLPLIGAGLAAGLLLSLFASRAVGAMLVQGAGVDAAVIAMASTTLAGAAILAGWLPARRATRIAPTIALRSE